MNLDGVSLWVSYLFGSRRPFLADPVIIHPRPSLVPFFPEIYYNLL